MGQGMLLILGFNNLYVFLALCISIALIFICSMYYLISKRKILVTREIENLRKRIEADQGNVQLHLELGRYLERIKDRKEALTIYKEILLCSREGSYNPDALEGFKRCLPAQILEKIYDGLEGLYFADDLRPGGSFDKDHLWFPDDLETCKCCHKVGRPSKSEPYKLQAHCRSREHMHQLLKKPEALWGNYQIVDSLLRLITKGRDKLE